MHYALAPYVGTGRPGDPYRPRGHDQAFWRSIDLRPDCTRPEGYALLVTPERVRDRGVIQLGPSPDDRWSLRSLASRLGVTLARGHLRHAAAALLLEHSREDGTRWRPLRPERRRGWGAVYRIWLGGLLWEMPVLAGGSSLTESFNTSANPAPNTTFTADHTWTAIAGDDWALGGASASLFGAVGNNVVRCDTPLASADHIATVTQVTLTFGGVGNVTVEVICRKANDGVLTFYHFQAVRSATGSVNRHALMKTVAGSETSLGQDQADVANGTVLGVEANGSGIRGLRNGATSVGPVTDTAITSGPHVGLRSYCDHAGNNVEVDSFSASDLAGPPINIDLPGPAVVDDIIPGDIIPAIYEFLGLVTDEDVLPDLTVQAPGLAGVPILTETWGVPDAELAVADHAWTRLGSGTRWKIRDQLAAFIGSAFGAEVARCDTPLNHETYTVRVPLARWRRLSANDVSEGVIVRKDETSAQTYYAIFVTQTATLDLIQLWRFVQGVSPVQLQTAPVVATEGAELEIRVEALAPPTTQVTVRLGGVAYINRPDDAIPSGRHVGVHGYLQGGTGDTLLRLGTLVASVDGQAPPDAPKAPGPGGYTTMRRRRRGR